MNRYGIQDSFHCYFGWVESNNDKFLDQVQQCLTKVNPIKWDTNWKLDDNGNSNLSNQYKSMFQLTILLLNIISDIHLGFFLPTEKAKKNLYYFNK